MTFYFYDLETTSGSPHTGRIMQFAGQRTDENMKPIGEPDNILVKLSDDVIPEPDAVLVHGITPQKANEEGITEAEFTKYFNNEIAEPNTTFVGYNNIRFDDEFMRRINYRNFYDPYQWHWKDGTSRWDLLDPIRMMRALRPEGLKWPEHDGKPTVKLELMAKENDIIHENAHDALSDVEALIELAKRFNESQPRLFSYLLDSRDKKKVAKLALANEPFVYTSGKYSSQYEKTTVVATIFKHPRRESSIVYDLREDPAKWFDKTPEQLVEHWRARFNEDIESLPVKTIQFNKCPAVAPLGVLDETSKKRINIDLDVISKNLATLQSNTEFSEKLQQALDIMENEQQLRLDIDQPVDNQIYDGFFSPADQRSMELVRGADVDDLNVVSLNIKNKRLGELLPLYKARNYPKSLSTEERQEWEKTRMSLLQAGGEKSALNRYAKRMNEIPKQRKLSEHEQYLLEELKLYVEAMLPVHDE